MMPKVKKRKTKHVTITSGTQTKLEDIYSKQDTKRPGRNNIQAHPSFTRCNNTLKKSSISTTNEEPTSKTALYSNKSYCFVTLDKSPKYKQSKLNFRNISEDPTCFTNKTDIHRIMSSAQPNNNSKKKVSIETNENIQRNQRNDVNNNTFKKYGICVPSYEDILNVKKNCDNYNKEIEDLIDSISPLPILEKFSLENQNCDVLVQDCKELSLGKLRTIFKNNIEYLDKIQEGNLSCKRHNMYNSGAPTYQFTFSSGMILFTNEQKQILISLLCKTFGSTPSLVDYYFKVLLPELCLKIFMDEYDLSHNEALQYLDNYPIFDKLP